MGSITQIPELAHESRVEEKIFEYFRYNYLLPEMQYRIDKYFADFAFPKEKIVVEFDGPMHEGREMEDEVRKSIIPTRGWTVVTIKPGITTCYLVDEKFRYTSVSRNLWQAVCFVSDRIKEENDIPLRRYENERYDSEDLFS